MMMIISDVDVSLVLIPGENEINTTYTKQSLPRVM